MIMATKYNDFNIHARIQKSFPGGSMFGGGGGPMPMFGNFTM